VLWQQAFVHQVFLIPGFDDVKRAALDAGALGCSISGSGPSMFALSETLEIANRVGDTMARVSNSQNIDCTPYVSKINEIGPKIIK